EQLVGLVVLEEGAVEAASGGVARVVKRGNIGILRPVEADQEDVEGPDADDLADELGELDERGGGLDPDVVPRLLHDLEHRLALLVAGVGDHRELELEAVLGPGPVLALGPTRAV